MSNTVDNVDKVARTGTQAVVMVRVYKATRQALKKEQLKAATVGKDTPTFADLIAVAVRSKYPESAR